MNPAASFREELTGPPVRSSGQVRLGALPHDSRVRCGDRDPRGVARFEAGRSKAAKSATGSTGEIEPREEGQVNVEQHR